MMAIQPPRTLAKRAAAVVAVLPLCVACLSAESRAKGPLDSEQFKRYWFAGKAELTRYALEQARYGEIRQGDAVLIFVTEDFLPDKQVKADSSDRAATGALPVLKLNFTKKFLTGIYPYSIMTSVFTPLDVAGHPRTLKTGTSVQEWCGHTYLQLNLQGNRYRVTGHSYFESEADRLYEIDARWLEDEIWTRIRLAPETLPTGTVKMIPGGQQSRLRHREVAVETARASVIRDSSTLTTYRIEYPDSGRTLAISFDTASPHGIAGWEESYRDGFGPNARTLTTRATRTHSIRTPYWTQNSTADVNLRKELGLE